MKKLILSVLFISLYFISFGQDYDIRFHRASIDCENLEVCYDIQLRPNGNVPLNLAGQNYRIYYDYSKAQFISRTSYLPSQYSELKIAQNVHEDASGAGPLPFDSTLGFLNLATDLSDVQNGGVLIGVGQWYSTAELCFTVTQDVIDDPDVCIEAVWGREGLTDAYATAFVVISKWMGPNSTQSSECIQFFDLDSSSGDEACFDISCGKPGLTVYDTETDENVGVSYVEVCLDIPASSVVTFYASTEDESAIAGLDYVGISQTEMTIPAGQTCTAIPITILNDDIYEGDETFKIIINDVSSNAKILVGEAQVTIVDDGSKPSLIILDTIVSEDKGFATIKFVLTGKAQDPIELKMNTQDLTATGGLDYETILDSIIVIPSEIEYLYFNIPIIDDDIYEGNEQFKVEISAMSSNFTIDKSSAIVTILDDEVIPTMTINDVTTNEEDGVATLTVSISGAMGSDLTFVVNTLDDTAVAGTDYVDISDEIFTLLAGDLQVLIPVVILDDNIPESTETFKVVISDVSTNVVVTKNIGIVTILDSDTIPCEAQAPVLIKN